MALIFRLFTVFCFWIIVHSFLAFLQALNPRLGTIINTVWFILSCIWVFCLVFNYSVMERFGIDVHTFTLIVFACLVGIFLGVSLEWILG